MHKQCQRRARPANFDPVARIYRWAEHLVMGRLLTRVREHFLPAILGSRQVLALGDGDGRFVARLLRSSPRVSVVAVDASAAMLRLLARRCAPDSNRLMTVHGDALLLEASLRGQRPDLVVTHFFLDCLTTQEVSSLATQVRKRLAPGGRWLLSDFAVPARQPWRWPGQLLIHGLYTAFGLLTGLQVRELPAIACALSTEGFSCVHHASWCKGLLYSQIWQLDAGPKLNCAQLPGPAPHPFPCDCFH